ncbi:unnamed protein product [Fusarium graminearum]|nr:unnamed protein product [Fusarium graminearum]
MLKHGSADILSSLGFCIPTAPLGSTWEITTANSDHCMVACERNWRVPGDKVRPLVTLFQACLYEDTQMICHPNLASRIPPLNPPRGLCRESDLPMNKRITTSNFFVPFNLTYLPIPEFRLGLPTVAAASTRRLSVCSPYQLLETTTSSNARLKVQRPSRKRCNHTTQINATTAMNGVIGPRKDDHVSVHALTF